MAYTKIQIGTGKAEAKSLQVASLFDLTADQLEALNGQSLVIEGAIFKDVVVKIADNNFDLLAPAYPCAVLDLENGRKLASYYPESYRGLVLEGVDLDNSQGQSWVTARYLPLDQVEDHSTVLLPAIVRDAATRQFETLQHYMDRVIERDLWLQSQTLESLLPYLYEETQEYAEALEQGDVRHMIEELGDVLWEVLFQTSVAERRGIFSLEQVLDGLNRKIRRRHPHVFDGVDVVDIADIEKLWQKVKEMEKKDAIR